MHWLFLPLVTLAAPAEPAPQRYPLPCFYAPRGGELDTFPDCAAQDADGTIRLAPAHRMKLDHDRGGLATVHVGKSFHYVARDGRSAPVMVMDNGADPFVDGRARSEWNGKIGYIDRALHLVIARRYDGAMPFEKGVAEVCIGCSLTGDGEHHWYAGGRWLRVDRLGRELAGKR
ncbi:WG repeat-containing protein [Sphingomonas sp. OTU376]|uniref:WG repeat-containing protein n=1 Tax=Sphingomonas sp. OTU376 TaxID=3043863 RepID=UPI00313D5C55